MKLGVLIVAAGKGSRIGGQAKQWRLLAGLPVIARTRAAFRAALPLAPQVIVLPPGEMHRAADFADAICAEGGRTRAESVRAGLAALPDDITHVLIHDAARPLVSGALIGRVVAALDEHDAAAPALAVTDALWRGGATETAPAITVTGTQDRGGLYRAQTPQGFRLAPLRAAHAGFGGDAADDVQVAQAGGMTVAIVAGEERNLKLTLPDDFQRAEAILRSDMAMDIRTGSGFDVHAFCAGDHVWLCGVKIPHDQGLLGHSDADVGMHALTDAIYGALAAGDIGRHFPPSDPQWKGAASHIFLRHAGQMAASRGYRISNCDVTLICETPKVGPHASAMQACLAGILGTEQERISVKATTSERLGFTGRKEGIAAIATVTLMSGPGAA